MLMLLSHHDGVRLMLVGLARANGLGPLTKHKSTQASGLLPSSTLPSDQNLSRMSDGYKRFERPHLGPTRRASYL